MHSPHHEAQSIQEVSTRCQDTKCQKPPNNASLTLFQNTLALSGLSNHLSHEQFIYKGLGVSRGVCGCTLSRCNSRRRKASAPRTNTGSTLLSSCCWLIISVGVLSEERLDKPAGLSRIRTEGNLLRRSVCSVLVCHPFGHCRPRWHSDTGHRKLCRSPLCYEPSSQTFGSIERLSYGSELVLPQGRRMLLRREPLQRQMTRSSAYSITGTC